MNLRYAFRTLARDRGFAAAAIFSLALGIGANTAIFSLINGILLREIPFPDSDRLVTLGEAVPKTLRQYGSLPVNGRHLLEWRAHSKTLEQVAAIDSRRMSLTGAGEPEQVGLAMISANLLPMLGVQPALGRGFLDEEDRPGQNRVVVLSDALWRRKFSSDRGIVGKTVLLDGAPHVVVGVLPPDFHFFANHQISPLASLEPRTDVFRPIAINAADIGWMGDFNYIALAKLKPHVSREQALAELNVIQAGIETKLSANEKTELRATMTPLKEQLTGQSRKGLLVLLAAVAAVLLIVCVNLANLMLARASVRRRDAAIRSALGASAGDLMGQVLSEALVLSLTGGAIGVLAAVWGVRLLVNSAPVDLPRIETVRVDGIALGFAMLVTLLTSVLFGILPALRLARAAPGDALRSGGRSGTESRRGLRVRAVLVGVEVALSATLLIAAGLLLNSFMRLLNVDRGFETDHTIAADIVLPGAKYSEAPQREQFYERVLEKIRAMPGVRAAGLVSVLPLEGEGWTDAVTVDGPRRPIVERPMANYRFVSPGYFQAMGLPLLRGRFLENSDRHFMPAVVSQALAKRIFGDQDPIGKRFRRAVESETPFEVIGVVGDTRAASLQGRLAPLVYVPYWFRSRTKVSLVARTGMDPIAAAPALRAAVGAVDADVPVAEIRTMDQVVAHSVAPRRFQLTLVLLFAIAALILASLGIYGVVAYMVAQRSMEIGIRMALGAEAGSVHRLVMSQGLAPVLCGLGVGVAAALAISRLMKSLLFQVSGHDPATFAGVCAVLLAIAALACFVPSFRAVRADPSAVLRYE